MAFFRLFLMRVISLLPVVLNEKQRVAKRKLIEDNRERRREEQVQCKVRPDAYQNDDEMTDEDKRLVISIANAYEQTSVKVTKTYAIVSIRGECLSLCRSTGVVVFVLVQRADRFRKEIGLLFLSEWGNCLLSSSSAETAQLRLSKEIVLFMFFCLREDIVSCPV